MDSVRHLRFSLLILFVVLGGGIIAGIKAGDTLITLGEPKGTQRLERMATGGSRA